MVTFLTIVYVSVKGSKTLKLIPFIVGVGAGYVLALIITLVGGPKILDLSGFQQAFVPFTFNSILSVPKFTFMQALTVKNDLFLPIDAAAIGNIAMTFVPIAVVELAQHIADHKKLRGYRKS